VRVNARSRISLLATWRTLPTTPPFRFSTWLSPSAGSAYLGRPLSSSVEPEGAGTDDVLSYAGSTVEPVGKALSDSSEATPGVEGWSLARVGNVGGVPRTEARRLLRAHAEERQSVSRCRGS
jgi:hypothetical protein